jgi:DNA polymerase-3 subunit beta
MKFSLPKSKLAACLQSVLQVVPSKSTLPILTNVLVEALEGKLKISATDLDISITGGVECEVTKKGSAALPARILFDIIRELPETDITIESVNSRVEIKIAKGSYKIASVSPDDFPKEIKIEANSLATMVRKTTFACSNDETRPALNGVLWQTKGDKMQMVATDGHRLAKVALENKKLKGMSEDIIIPPKVLNLIPKFTEGQNREVGIIFGDNNIIFNLGEYVLTSRLIDGPYPNFEQVIPQNSDKKLRVSKEDLGGAVRRVSILSNTLTHQVKFGVKKGSLTLSTSNADLGGEGVEIIDCDYDGEPVEIGYNATYITDILARMPGDEVTFEFSSPVSAGVMYSTEVSKEDFLCLVMPLRLAE